MLCARHFFLLALIPLCLQGRPSNDAIAQATAAVEAAAPRAQADPARPIFHVTSPAQWINDPNGPIFHRGFYHLFYQLHPFSDESGPKYWGHVRSRDLATWEPLPIALWPSSEAGEEGVWSGCCTVNGEGEPMIFYTSIARGKPAIDHAEQWAATSGDDLMTWQKSSANPVLTEALHGEQKVYDWRDPYVFSHGDQTFMVTGGSLNHSQGGQAVVILYEAANVGLTKWKYRGVLFQHPDPDVRTAECPNFFQLGDEWVLLVSPYGKVQYFIGDFDAEAGRFQPRTRGMLDYGSSFYAPNTLQVPDGRRLVWGWVNGFPGGRGWSGCLSLPRLLELSRDGKLRQRPAPQLAELRGDPIVWRNLGVESGGEILKLPNTNTLEILAEIGLQTAKTVELRLKSGARDSQPIVVTFNGSELGVMDGSAQLGFSGGERTLNLRIFIDRSVLEVFANDTACVTRVIAPLDASATLEIRAEGGTANVRRVQAWPMKTIW